MPRRFKDLSEREILALAISLEEEDARIYGDFADGLRDEYPSTARLFEDMIAEESGHRARLIEILDGDPSQRAESSDVVAVLRSSELH